jgi:hypothetical protein
MKSRVWLSRSSSPAPNGYVKTMFQCDTCHTEYGGIRGLPSGTCPRCRVRRADLSRPVAASASLAGATSLAEASAYPGLPGSALLNASWATPSPLRGEIARLDRSFRF